MKSAELDGISDYKHTYSLFFLTYIIANSKATFLVFMYITSLYIELTMFFVVFRMHADKQCIQ